MHRLLAIIWRELYVSFVDRNLVLIRLVTPLALAVLTGFAFAGLASPTPIQNIPVAVVNLDQGGVGGVNYGQLLAAAFLPGSADQGGQPRCDPGADAGAAGKTLVDLTDAVQLTDPQVARAGVDSGQYTAAIIIPADFTRRLAYSPEHPQVEPVAVEVYANKGRGVSAELIRSAVSAVTGQIAAGSIAIAAVGDQLVERARSDPALGLRLVGALADGSIRPDLACTFSAAFTPVHIDSSGGGSSLALNTLTLVGAGQAMFFMLLAAQDGATAIFIERRQGTLQRLLISPTPRLIILLGKLVGTFANCVVQLILLFIALSLVGSLLSGRLLSIWGNDYLAVILIILAGTLAACGFGTVILALARTPEQGSLLATVFSIAFAVMGGAFGASLPRETAQFSMVYWVTDAFAKLAAGHGEIALNLFVLVVQGGITFLVGVWLFNRRLES